MKHKALFAGALAVTTTAAAAPSWRDYPGVANTSFVEPSGDRAIQLSAIVDATPRQAFDAFATEAGFASWAVKLARIDLRVGGIIESSYNPQAKIGDPENIRNRIEAYLPGHLLVLRNVNAPKALPGREAFARTVTIVEFAGIAPGRTRVTVTNAGYGQSAEDAAAYAHFEWGDAYTLDALRRHFAAR